MDRMCYYDEAYTKADAKEIGFCGRCKIKNCENNREHRKINSSMDIIVGMTILYGYPAVLFKHENGYAWKYKLEVKDLGDITEERAIEMFEWNFNKCQ